MPRFNAWIKNTVTKVTTLVANDLIPLVSDDPNASKAITTTNLAADAAFSSRYGLTGTGFPEGVVTAPVGTVYRDTAATSGAVTWVKATGAGNTGWKVAYGDTGWRDVTAIVEALPSWDSAGMSIASDNVIAVRRINDVIHFGIRDGLQWTQTTGTAAFIATLGVGFGTSANNRMTSQWPVFARNSASTIARLSISDFATAGDLNFIFAFSAATASNTGFGGQFVSREAWPATLPGTAA